MEAQDTKRTRRNLILFTMLILGLAGLASVVEPLTVPPDAEPGTAGFGQLLWLIAPLGVMLVLRIFGGDGWGDLGLRPNCRGDGFWWLVSILVFSLSIALSVLSGLIYLRAGKALWVSPGAEGVISIVLMFAFGCWLHQRRKHK